MRAAPAVELDERLLEEGEADPPPTPAAGDGELANPALALVVRADDAPRQLVRSEGELLPDEDLSPSDFVIPPSDLTLEETKRLFSAEGLIPDVPA